MHVGSYTLRAWLHMPNDAVGLLQLLTGDLRTLHCCSRQPLAAV